MGNNINVITENKMDITKPGIIVTDRFSPAFFPREAMIFNVVFRRVDNERAIELLGRNSVQYAVMDVVTAIELSRLACCDIDTIIDDWESMSGKQPNVVFDRSVSMLVVVRNGGCLEFYQAFHY